MKKLGVALLLASAVGLGACAQTQVTPISRDQLVQNIDPILRMEKRLDQVMYYTKMLGSLGGLSQGKSTELKSHLDIYYVYYLASNVQLAKGNMAGYQAHLKLAEKELDVMESILKDGMDKDFEFDYSGENKDLSRSKL